MPKPNFDQTDPRKGDFIKGDRSFLNMDETLTQSGSPADAKATGDAVDSLQANIDEVSEVIATKADADHIHDDAVTVEGGAVFNISEVFGEGPYVIEFTEGNVSGGVSKETDPTVPDWAKEPQKPTYTASEVGALPDSTQIPNALSDLVEDSVHRTVTDAEKATWNAKSNFSGNYNDLTNKPAIPSIAGLATEAYVNNAVANISVPVKSVNGKTGDVSLNASDVGAAQKPTFTTVTMAAANWSGNIYSFESIYPHASYDISIEVAPTATADQFTMFGSAMICGSIDSNIATALGVVPTADIPIIVKVVAK